MRQSSIVLALLCAGQAALAQRAVGPLGPEYKSVATLDSGFLSSASMSPNGRWVLAAMGDRTNNDQALFMAPVGGSGAMTRLTTAGFNDRNPRWSPRGDMVVFVSNRATRAGQTGAFGMALQIDPATGKAVGSPRQVTTEPVATFSGVSPDGSAVAYSTAGGKEIRVVPINGGIARTVVKTAGAAGPVWSADGKWLTYTQCVGAPRSCTLYRVPSGGGSPQVLATNPDGAVNLLRGNPPIQLWAFGQKTNRAYAKFEARTPSGQVIARLSPPNDLRLAGGVVDNSGAPLFARANLKFVTHLMAADGSGHRAITTAENLWPDDWADEQHIIGDGWNNGAPFVAMISTSGAVGPHVALPRDARSMGWDGVAGHSIAFRRGRDLRPGTTGDSPLYAADLTTGRIRLVAPHSIERRVTYLEGPGGQEGGAGEEFLVLAPAGAKFRLESVSPTGATRLLRNFANPPRCVAVSGHTVAWSELHGDTMSVFVATRPDGKATRVYTAKGLSTRPPPLTFSWSGATLAVIPDDPTPGPILLMPITRDGALGGAVDSLSTAGLKFPWGAHWTHDDRSLVFVAGNVSSNRNDVVRLSVAPGSTPQVLTRDQVDDVTDASVISPNGTVAYPISVPVSATLYRVDFRAKRPR